jgi:HEAT repeat protein
MEKFNALEKSWITSFESSNTERILKSLYEVRNSGSIKILPVLLNLLNDRTDSEINTEIIRLVSELKSPEAVPVIAKSLKENDFGNYEDDIIAACWQSGLDFSSYLSVFAEMFIKGDYSSALESFTVIEETLINATEDEVYACIHFLKEHEYMVSDEKMPLYRELQNVVQSY